MRRFTAPCDPHPPSNAGFSSSKRDVPVPTTGPPALLPFGDSERLDQGPTGVRGLDHVVDVASLRRDVRVCEPLDVVGDQLLTPPAAVARLLKLAPEDDVDRALGAHHGDLRARPGHVEVGADVLGAHDAVSASVCLARYNRQL